MNVNKLLQQTQAVVDATGAPDSSHRAPAPAASSGGLQRSKSQSALDSGNGPSALSMSVGSEERQRLMRAINSVSPRDDAPQLVSVGFACGQTATLQLRDPSERVRNRLETELDEMEQAAMYAGLPHFAWSVSLGDGVVNVSVSSS